MRVHLSSPSLLVLAALASLAPAQTPPAKKLIEFGWDEPDPKFMRKHVAAMEGTPFDGTVFHLSTDFLWQCWGKRAFTEGELAAPVEDLRRTPFQRFTHNFLRFNVTPGDVDWFDDFAPILNNARLAARAAQAGRAAGILFDVEQYNAAVFNYSKQRDAKTKPWAEYATQARRRGREVMGAFQGEFPGLVVLLTWSYSLPHYQSQGDEQKLPQADYGLLKPFLDGLFDAAAGKTKLVDGHESSYGYKAARQFDEARRRMTHDVLPWVPDRDKFTRHASAGFGLWLDYDWRKKGWDEKDPSKNYFTPAAFEASLKKALETSDEYVWIYTEKPRWWAEPDGKPTGLPPDYDRAIRRAAGRPAPALSSHPAK